MNLRGPGREADGKSYTPGGTSTGGCRAGSSTCPPPAPPDGRHLPTRYPPLFTAVPARLNLPLDAPVRKKATFMTSKIGVQAIDFGLMPGGDGRGGSQLRADPLQFARLTTPQGGRKLASKDCDVTGQGGVLLGFLQAEGADLNLV